MSVAPLLELNRTETDYPRDATIAGLFAQQAACTPDAIAVVAGDVQLSYRELDERSTRLAQRLRDQGVKPDTLVGVAVERSDALVVSLLAILRAGGAYVPLDIHYPKERLVWILEDSKMQVLVTTPESRQQLLLHDRSVTTVDVNESAAGLGSTPFAGSDATSSNLAYVIYTSGSTGKPKGVMIENRNVVNFFTGMDRVLGRDPGVWLAVTSISFDISVLELLWTLTRGYKVVLHGDEGTRSIADEIAAHHVTHLQMTPSLARMLTLDPRAFASLSTLKKLLLGGEVVPASLVRLLREVFKGEIHNMYGPTETTVWSTEYLITNADDAISIGRPIADTQIHLLGPDLIPVLAGAIGEVFIGGDGVARGYWDRPDLTAERFVRLPPLSTRPIYRTGDLARWLPSGNLEFVGRADFQIKLRGHRIEPGEIEALLEQLPGVKQAVVVAREDREGDRRLAAYLVGEASRTTSAAVLRTAIESKVPDYMVPSAFVFLPAFPLTDNGKIDRKALLALPPPSFATGAVAPLSDCEPISDIERIVAHAWQDALAITTVGLNDNFFDLGAHSLTVAEVHARLQAVLGREIPLVDLFHFSNVKELAARLAGTQQQSQVSDRAQRRRTALQR
ncbi:MAG TPA: non-ribosomal peptide synthetase [Terracidiphilus sp.]|nr:non-ribosomal peptide synthetase [Terracidiphilus sp.]